MKSIKNGFPFFLILFLSFSYTYINANPVIDSLKLELSKTSDEKYYIDLLNEIAFQYLNESHEEAEKVAKKALNRAQKIAYQKGIGDAYVRLGTCAWLDGDCEKAYTFFKNAIPIRAKNSSKIPAASIYNNMGICEMEQNNFKKAIIYYREGLAIIRKESINEIHGRFYNNIAEAFSNLKDYKSSIVYLDSTMLVWNTINRPDLSSSAIREQGRLYLEFGNWENAREKFEESLNLAQNNSVELAKAYTSLGNLYKNGSQQRLALENYLQAYKLKYSLSKTDEAVVTHSLANLYTILGNSKLALKFFKESLFTYNELKNNEKQAMLYYDLGVYYQKQNKQLLAKDYYLKSFSFFRNSPKQLMKSRIAYSLSEVYEKLGINDSAFYYSRLSYNLEDSINIRQLEAIHFQNNLQEKNAQLELENQKKAKINQRNNFLIALLFAGVLILTAMFALYQNRQKRQIAEIQMQQSQLETNNAYMEIDELLKNQELTISQARLDEKDTTYKQIGKDLHDGLGVMLSTIKLYFDGFSEQLKGLKTENEEKRNKTFELLDEAVKEVRRISHNMQTGTLKKFGLAEAVKDLGTTINDSGQLKVKVYTHGLKERIPSNLEYKLYKIIQELVGNALKHAKASTLSISLTKQENALNIMVEDDGVGFDTSKIGEKDGIGLKNIAFRTTDLGGTCHFDSVRGRGTNVIIDIPLKNENNS